jgi:hypothetical protein
MGVVGFDESWKGGIGDIHVGDAFQSQPDGEAVLEGSPEPLNAPIGLWSVRRDTRNCPAVPPRWPQTGYKSSAFNFNFCF